MREKCRTVPRLTLLGLPWKLSGLTLTKGVSAVCLTKGRNHRKLVRCFYDFGFAWNSDPSPVLFSWTWLLSNSHLLDGHSPAQRLPYALGYFTGVMHEGKKPTTTELNDREERLESWVARPSPLQLQPLSWGNERNSWTCCPAVSVPSLSSTSVHAARRWDAPIDNVKIRNTLHIIAFT